MAFIGGRVWAYYNENNPFAADWLRNLIAEGLIAPGVVDDRSIVDVQPADLSGFRQVHLFGGIGVWSLALRCAGWPDERPVTTGSCPCQPFSSAGAGEGFDDPRHLWPHMHRLIAGEYRPAVIFGEQVASKDSGPWIDLVQDDLEALGYAFGAVPFPSAGVGAPHIRDRLYWVADGMAHANDSGRLGGRSRLAGDGGAPSREQPERLRHALGVADASGDRQHEQRRECGEQGFPRGGRDQPHNRNELDGLGYSSGAGSSVRECSALVGEGRGSEGRATEQPGRPLGWMADANGWDAGAEREQPGREYGQQPEDCRAGGMADAGRLSVRGRGPGDMEGAAGEDPGRAEQREWLRPDAEYGGSRGSPGPTNGFWRDADWLFCRDGRWRPVEPGTSPLAHGAPARVGRLHGFGNAINRVAAQVFIEAYLDSRAGVMEPRDSDV